MKNSDPGANAAGPIEGLSRRERQIMDIVFRLGQTTAGDIHAHLPDAPTYTTVRGLLRILVEKGRLSVDKAEVPYVYRPTTPRDAAGTTVLSHVARTFFGGSPARVMAALLGSPEIQVSDGDLDRLARLLEDARGEKADS